MRDLIRSFPCLQTAVVMWASIPKWGSHLAPAVRCRPSDLNVIFVGPAELQENDLGAGDKIPYALDRCLDLFVVTRLEITACWYAKWPAYLGSLALPALTDLRFGNLFADDLPCVQAILLAAGRNLRRLHLFSHETLDHELPALLNLNLPELCPAFEDLGWDDYSRNVLPATLAHLARPATQLASRVQTQGNALPLARWIVAP